MMEPYPLVHQAQDLMRRFNEWGGEGVVREDAPPDLVREWCDEADAILDADAATSLPVDLRLTDALRDGMRALSEYGRAALDRIESQGR